MKFAFELVDRASKVAERISGSLGKLSAKLAQTGTVADTVAGKQVGGRLTRALDFMKGKAAVAYEGLRAGAVKGREALGAMSAAASLVGPHLLAAAAAAGGFAAAGGKLITDAARFKEDTGFALRFTLGSSQAAGKTLGYIQSISNTLGTSAAEAAGMFKELSSGGFSSRESEMLVQLASDLKAVNGGQAVALGSLVDPLNALKRNDALTADSFKGLEAAGMSRNRVYEEIAKTLGVTIDKNPNVTKAKVDKALAGVQRGQKAVDLFTKINLQALGEKAFGGKAKEFQDTTLTGSLDKVKNRWESLMGAVSDTGLAKGLVSILQSVADALDPTTESGKQLVAVFDKFSKTAGEALGKVSAADIVGAISKAADAADRLISAVQRFGSGFREGFAEAKTTLAQIEESLGLADSKVKITADGFKIAGKALGYFVVGIAAAVGVVAGTVELIYDAFATLPDNMRAIGRDVMTGLGEGLDSAKAWLVGKFNDLAALLPESVRKLLQIRSPSRVMMKLGAYSAEGFAQGIERAGPSVERAADAGLTQPAMQANVKASGGRGGSVTVAPGAVQINVPAGSNVDAETMARLVDERLRALFAEMGLELGAVT